MLAKEYLTNKWYLRSIWEEDLSMPDNEVFDAVVERYVLPDFKAGKRSREYFNQVDCVESETNLWAAGI